MKQSSTRPIRLSEYVKEIEEAPHEVFYFELTLDERMKLARDPKKFLFELGLPVTHKQKVSLHNHYELHPEGKKTGGYLIAATSEENLILACVNCDSTDSEFSDHKPTQT